MVGEYGRVANRVESVAKEPGRVVVHNRLNTRNHLLTGYTRLGVT